MGVGRDSPAASERDRDERWKADDPSTPFQTQTRGASAPVAMSLRTRERSSLALKLIVDQISASAENSQPMDSLGGRTVVVQEKREDDGKRDGQRVTKELSGAARCAGPDLDARQRTGGVQVPRKQGVGEESTSFHLKACDLRSDQITRRQQVNKVLPPQGLTDGAHSVSQLASEMRERTVNTLRFQDAGGKRDCIQKSPSEDLSNVMPWAPGAAALPQDLPLRKRPSELDLAFRKTQSPDSSSVSSGEAAFGSPINGPPPHQNLVENVNQHNSTTSWSVHSSPLPQAACRSSTANSPNKQPIAQLTIFYRGMVNVYDDVPADRANAIMLLAGNGNPRSTNYEWDRLPQDMPPPATQSPVAASMKTGLGTVVSGTTSAKTFSPSVAANSSSGPSSLPTAMAVDPKPDTAAKRSHPGIELPHARKASLARFLEKRKDRVQVKQPFGGEGQDDENGRPEHPSSPKRQRFARSRSPSPTRTAPGSR